MSIETGTKLLAHGYVWTVTRVDRDYVVYAIRDGGEQEIKFNREGGDWNFVWECRAAYLQSILDKGFWMVEVAEGCGGFNYTEIVMNEPDKRGYHEYHLHYSFKDGEGWVADE